MVYRSEYDGEHASKLWPIEENIPCSSRKTLRNRLNNSFIGAIFQSTRWRNRKRSFNFASSPDSLLSFAGKGEWADFLAAEVAEFMLLMSPLRGA